MMRPERKGVLITRETVSELRSCCGVRQRADHVEVGRCDALALVVPVQKGVNPNKHGNRINTKTRARQLDRQPSSYPMLSLYTRKIEMRTEDSHHQGCN